MHVLVSFSLYIYDHHSMKNTMKNTQIHSHLFIHFTTGYQPRKIKARTEKNKKVRNMEIYDLPKIFSGPFESLHHGASRRRRTYRGRRRSTPSRRRRVEPVLATDTRKPPWSLASAKELRRHRNHRLRCSPRRQWHGFSMGLRPLGVLHAPRRHRHTTSTPPRHGWLPTPTPCTSTS